MALRSSTLAWKIPWWAAVHGVRKNRTRLSDFTFTFHFHALEKEMATHSSVLAWRIPGTGEPGGLPSMGSHRVGHNWSDLAAAAAAARPCMLSSHLVLLIRLLTSFLSLSVVLSQTLILHGSWCPAHVRTSQPLCLSLNGLLWTEANAVPTESVSTSLTSLTALCWILGFKVFWTKEATEEQSYGPPENPWVLEVQMGRVTGPWRSCLFVTEPPIPHLGLPQAKSICQINIIWCWAAASTPPTAWVETCWQLQKLGVADWRIIMADRKM